jgi:hypothetical protein
MSPGATAFTRMPSGPNSAAIWRVSPATPAVGGRVRCLFRHADDRQAGSHVEDRATPLAQLRQGSRHSRNVLERLALIQYSKSSSDVSWADFELPTPRNVGKHIETAEPRHASFDERR